MTDTARDVLGSARSLLVGVAQILRGALSCQINSITVPDLFCTVTKTAVSF